MNIRDEGARVELWVSEFPTYADKIYEWAIRRYNPLKREMEECCYGRERSYEIAVSEAEKSFEFFGGRL